MTSRFVERLGALVALGLLGALVVGCSGESVEEASASVNGIDREAVLGELDEVRDLFAQRSPLDSELLADVDYSDNQLTVTLADGVGGVGQAEQVCNDLSDAIQLPDLTIDVIGPDGEPLATCDFAAPGTS